MQFHMKLSFFPHSAVHVSEGLLCIDFHTSAILNLTTTQRSNSHSLIYRGANRDLEDGVACPQLLSRWF